LQKYGDVYEGFDFWLLALRGSFEAEKTSLLLPTLQVELLAPATSVTEWSAPPTYPALASPGISRLNVCDSDNFQVIIYFAALRSAVGDINRIPSAVCVSSQMTLIELFWTVVARGLGFPVAEKCREGVARLHGVACDGRYVGRLEATLEEAGVRSGSRIEVLVGRMGGGRGAEDGSSQTEGQSLSTACFS
jgi:hypothetical protein